MNAEQPLDRLELLMEQILAKLDLHTAQKEYHTMQLEMVIETLNKQNENFAYMRRAFADRKEM